MLWEEENRHVPWSQSFSWFFSTWDETAKRAANFYWFFSVWDETASFATCVRRFAAPRSSLMRRKIKKNLWDQGNHHAVNIQISFMLFLLVCTVFFFVYLFVCFFGLVCEEILRGNTFSYFYNPFYYCVFCCNCPLVFSSRSCTLKTIVIYTC